MNKRKSKKDRNDLMRIARKSVNFCLKDKKTCPLVSNQADTNQPDQVQKLARALKFRV